jgi:hypothetical protein
MAQGAPMQSWKITIELDAGDEPAGPTTVSLSNTYVSDGSQVDPAEIIAHDCAFLVKMLNESGRLLGMFNRDDIVDGFRRIINE